MLHARFDVCFNTLIDWLNLFCTMSLNGHTIIIIIIINIIATYTFDFSRSSVFFWF